MEGKSIKGTKLIKKTKQKTLLYEEQQHAAAAKNAASSIASLFVLKMVQTLFLVGGPSSYDGAGLAEAAGLVAMVLHSNRGGVGVGCREPVGEEC